MKNFEKHIDKIAADYVSRTKECIIDNTHCALEGDCKECFKTWALTDSEPTPDPLALLKRCKKVLDESATNLERVASIERGEEWTGGEPTLGTCRVLGQIKEASRHASTLLSDIEKMEAER